MSDERRNQLGRLIGIEERALPGEQPAALARRLAHAKAKRAMVNTMPAS